MRITTGKRFTQALIGGGVALALLAPVVAEAVTSRAAGKGSLRDFLAATTEPTDGVTATARAWEDGTGSVVKLRLAGFAPAFAGNVYGAHLHTGPCVTGDGVAAGPHYNAGGGISASTEVWLDFEVQSDGTAAVEAHVPFLVTDGGAASIVIHALPTDPTTGAAGTRMACLPIQF
jgi:Cu/Zn superoxide dismutase